MNVSLLLDRSIIIADYIVLLGRVSKEIVFYGASVAPFRPAAAIFPLSLLRQTQDVVTAKLFESKENAFSKVCLQPQIWDT